jgi:Ribonuclease G/E
MRHSNRRLIEEDLQWKFEERKRKLELVRAEFMRMHEAHILPETAKLRSSIWSSWFSGFSFK